MSCLSPFSEASSYQPVEWLAVGGVRRARFFTDPRREYQASRAGCVVFDRSDRALLSLRGADRARWLHNLVTAAVLHLEPCRGTYAFALNVKGRILFDLNILCLPDVLWVDLDASAVAPAAAHFDRHLFSEDVRMEDISGQYARLGCCGAQAAPLARELGAANFAALPALGSTWLENGSLFVRHDFAGAPAFELILPRGQAALWWERVVRLGAVPAGHGTLDLLRIEAGIPWLFRDFDERTLPPETGQIERGISYHKGCYIGHEIVERMRSHGALPRRLVRLQLESGQEPLLPATLRRDNLDVGQITSLAPHPAHRHYIGLGYLKTAVTGFADLTVGDPPRPVLILSH